MCMCDPDARLKQARYVKQSKIGKTGLGEGRKENRAERAPCAAVDDV